MDFEVELQEFSGPLQLLLELIQKEELPITEVSLAEVAKDYLDYVDSHDVATEEIADFLVVATKLLLLKSQAILPEVEAEEEDVDPSTLASQLKMYKAFVDISEHIDERFSGAKRMHRRTSSTADPTVEYPMPENVTSDKMQQAFRGLMKRLSPFFSLKKASMERAVSVHDRLEQIRGAVLERSRMTFSDVLQGSRNKTDVVVSFLALLELVKQKTVHTIQGETFEDIVIKHAD